MCIMSTTKNKSIHFVIIDRIARICLQKGKKIKKKWKLVIQRAIDRKMPVLLEN